MTSEHRFHLEIHAPHGLAGIEPYLPLSLIPLEPYFTNFTKQVILKLAYDGHDIEFGMDGSLHKTMHASGFIVGTFDDAISKINSLSQALRAANFPHYIGVDDDLTDRSATIVYRCNRNAIEWV